MSGDGAARGGEGGAYTPATAAEMLGLSGPGLRRLSLIYERVEGPLPRDDRGGRLWPAGALERLEAARLAEREGRAVSVEAALRGETIAGEALPRSDAGGRSGVDAAAVAGELRAMREALEEQNRVLGIMAGRLEALERENRELREAGPPVPGIGPAAADPAPPRGEENADEASDGGETVTVRPAGTFGPAPTGESTTGKLWRLVGRLVGRR